MIQIIEITGRAIQGMTRPYICRADDGNTWFVKGVGAGRSSQVYEWIAGSLGRSFGLQIAPFEIVDVPDELLEVGNLTDYAELGAGPAFGSCKQQVVEFSQSIMTNIPQQVQLDVFVFDWWIRNFDRTLTEKGGNPNLFWDPGTEGLIVIDHNQAFDAVFSVEDYLNYHVFRGQAARLIIEQGLKDIYVQRFANVLQNWQVICDRIPEPWFYADQEMTVPADFELDDIYNVLNRYQQNDFWNMT